MQNLGTLRQLSLGDLADDGRERRGRKIMPSLMATSLRWRAHSARTKIQEKINESSFLVGNFIQWKFLHKGFINFHKELEGKKIKSIGLNWVNDDLLVFFLTEICNTRTKNTRTVSIVNGSNCCNCCNI
jgi:hypothetical protein